MTIRKTIQTSSILVTCIFFANCMPHNDTNEQVKISENPENLDVATQSEPDMTAPNQFVQLPKILYFDSENTLVADMENRGTFSVRNDCLVVKPEGADKYYQPIFRPSVKIAMDEKGEFVFKLPNSTLPLDKVLYFSGAETQYRGSIAESALKNLACNLPLYTIGDISQ